MFNAFLQSCTGTELFAYHNALESAMYSDEGPSTRPFFLRRRSPSVDLESLELSSQEGDNASQETAEPDRGNVDESPPLKSEFCLSSRIVSLGQANERARK